MQLQGSCLCKAVTLHVEVADKQLGACHCEMCMKWGSGPLFALECGSAVRISGEAAVSVFASSAWAERGFCACCGTHLFYRLKESGQFTIPVGVFECVADWRLSEQIFIDEKPCFYSLAEQTPMLTGEQVFAKYAGE